MAEFVDSKPNVDVGAKAPHSRSKIPYSGAVAGTYRFGEYAPHFVMEAVNGDKIPLRSVHDLRTYTLKAPLMQDVKIKKDYFQIPMEAILPLNWDKIYTNPPLGSDIDANKANCIFTLDFSSFSTVETKLYTLFASKLCVDSPTASDKAFCMTYFLKYLVLLERFFSDGSLLSSLDCKLSEIFRGIIEDGDSGNYYDTFDSYLDEVYSTLENDFSLGYFPILIDNQTYYVYPSSDAAKKAGAYAMSVRNFIDFIRDSNSWSFTGNNIDTIPSLFSFTSSEILCPFLMSHDSVKTLDPLPLNVSRVLSYQLVCSHFYSNDKVDYIYSADLYRQNVKSVVDKFFKAYNGQSIAVLDSFNVFTYNGIDLHYDVLSGFTFDRVLSNFKNAYISDNIYNPVFDFYRLIFGFNRSLRFVDYFTGSKTRPLAVGDVNVSVSGGNVNVVDITRNIQRQKFLNFANRVGRKFEEYVSKFGGNYVKPDFHNPLFLAHTSDSIGSYQVENTGNTQFNSPNSITSILRSNSGKSEFTIDVDRPSIILGITYFDISRFYAHNVSRFFFHYDRFDMFNPFMQFVGDQDIKRPEVTSRPHSSDGDWSSTFGYQLRHSEYKTRVPVCFGGFSSGQLPGFSFKAFSDISETDITNQKPDFIRSRPSEFDEFYLSLTGYSLANYFHFIVINNNICEPSRPMVYAPEIL